MAYNNELSNKYLLNITYYLFISNSQVKIQSKLEKAWLLGNICILGSENREFRCLPCLLRNLF